MNYLNTKTILFSFLLLIFVAPCNAQNQNDALEASDTSLQVKKTTESKYKVGQMWSYKTRPNEKDSYFIVVKVETDEKLGNIVHIALRNLKMKSPNSPDNISNGANHLPFSDEAISKSAIKLLKEKVELPDFEEGYKMWKGEFDEQRAGIYTATIAEIVGIMENKLNQ